MKKGFTLIEVLIVIVILGIIMGVGSAQFREFSRRQATASVKRQLLADVRAAQADAANGRKPPGCTGTLQGFYFSVTGTAGPASYEVFARCLQGVTNQDINITTVQLPQGFSFSALPSVNPVIFRPVSQGTNLATNQEITITIVNPGINNETLTIKASGEIR